MRIKVRVWTGLFIPLVALLNENNRVWGWFAFYRCCLSTVPSMDSVSLTLVKLRYFCAITSPHGHALEVTWNDADDRSAQLSQSVSLFVRTLWLSEWEEVLELSIFQVDRKFLITSVSASNEVWEPINFFSPRYSRTYSHNSTFNSAEISIVHLMRSRIFLHLFPWRCGDDTNGWSLQEVVYGSKNKLRTRRKEKHARQKEPITQIQIRWRWTSALSQVMHWLGFQN